MHCRVQTIQDQINLNLSKSYIVARLILMVGSTMLWHLPDLHSQENPLSDSVEMKIEALQVKASMQTGFTLMKSERTGLSFENHLDERNGAANRVLFNGSGVAVGDVDGDGLPDLFFCGIDSQNHLYRNQGNWKFERIPISDLMALPGAPSRGAVFADLNGDHQLDLLVSTVGAGVKVFVNKGAFKFADATTHVGTETKLAATSMALADVDGNGTLDLYVTNNRTEDIRDRARVPITRVGGRILPPEDLRDRLFVHQGQLHEYGEPDQLYLNDGTGKMTLVSWIDGTFRENGHALKSPPKDWGLSAMFRDFNQDGYPDLYVCNDFWTPDRIWINDRKGGFEAAPPESFPVTSASSMGLDGADIDADGDLDLFVVDMLSRDPAHRKRQQPAANLVADIPNLNGPYRQENWNTLLLQRDNEHFSEVAHFAGLEASNWSWCPIFVDIDLDGYQDVLISTGYPHDMQDMDTLRLIQSRQHDWGRYQNEEARQKAFTREMMEHIRIYPPLNLPIVSFRNRGNGTFEEMTDQWGTDHLGIHQGFATGDLDGDGDLDLVVNNLNGPVELYQNKTSKPRIQIRLANDSLNTQAIGANLQFHQKKIPIQTREIISGGRYISGSSTEVTFATPLGSQSGHLNILWRDGLETTIQNIQPNHRYHIRRIQKTQTEASQQSKQEHFSNPMFLDASDQINHHALSSPSNDHLKQPLLPWSLSYQGPGIVCAEVNADKMPDIVIGAEHGQKPSVYLAQANGDFVRNDLSTTLWNDASGMLVLPVSSINSHLLMGLNGYESEGKPAFLEHNFKGQHRSLYSNRMFGAGPMAAGPLNGKGGMSLFIGGHAISGRYPETHPSLILHQTPGAWRIDEENTQTVQSIRLPQSAIWSDLTADGFPELLVSTEWGPIHVFENQNGKLINRTKNWGFEAISGLWKGITTGDFDGNGLLDIVAGNWGLNSPWEASSSKPLTIYYGEWTRPGSIDLMETEYHPNGILAPSRSLTELGQTLPFLFDGLKGFNDFSERSVEYVLGNKMTETHMLEVTTLKSMMFLNQGNGNFNPISLPKEIQQAPVFGIQSGDLNGDGHIDLILGQNTSHIRPGFPKQTSGACWLLLGKGDGSFDMPLSEKTGIHIQGDMRAIALGDLNHDHLLDVLITQNEGSTKLFLNHSKTSGGTVIRFEGANENPSGYGVQFCFQYAAGQKGPIHEIKAGSGWLAQNQPLGILSSPSNPQGIWVRWPGGRTDVIELDENQESILIKEADSVQHP